jgi:hypothetical protein
MPAFNYSSFNRSARAAPAQSYGYLIDQLKIKENLLASDGKLAPGDYKILLADAQKLLTNPGLTQAERSNVQVKVSDYQKAMKNDKLKDNQDIKRINDEISNDMKKVSYTAGNDPIAVLTAKAANLEGKIFRLNENIRQINSAGGDASQQELERLKANDEWRDTTDGLSAAANWQPGQPPIQGFIMNVSTNNRGEIREVSFTRTPDSKHIMTSAVLGGFQVAGLPNAQIGSQENQNVFVLGNQKFSASTNLRPGPDGTFKQDTLVTEGQKVAQGARGRTKATSEYIEIPAGQVPTQRYSQPGEWIQGNNGEFYKSLDDGNFEKYINATKEDLGIDESSLMTHMPKELINSTVIPKTIRTNDAALMKPQSTATSTPGFAPNTSTSTIPGPTTAPVTPGPTTPAGRSRTPGPINRAPSTAPDIAQSLGAKAKSFLGSLFGS